MDSHPASPAASPGGARPDREPGHAVVIAQQQKPDLETLIAAATTEAIRQLLSSNTITDLRSIAHSAARKYPGTFDRSKVHYRAVEEQLNKRAAALTSPTLTADLLKDLKPARIKLLRCDDESCEYEDLIDGTIKVKPITKKVVKLRWEEPPKNILIVKKPNDPIVNGMFEDLVTWLTTDLKLTVLVEPGVKTEVGSKFPQLRTWTVQEQKELFRKVHFVICVGGDGTILWAQGLFNCTAVPPIISFAAGSLGFLTAFEFVNHRAIIQSFITHGGFLTLRMRLQCQFLKSNTSVPIEDTDVTALNEVLIDRGPSPFLTRLECYCDGVYTTTVQADGVIIGTTTGSTAYSLAAGGSMVHPLVPCILFTPVCPHSLSFRPLIFPDSAGLRIKVPSGTRSSAWLTCDGRSRVELSANDSVSIRMSDYCVAAGTRVTLENGLSMHIEDLAKRPYHKVLARDSKGTFVPAVMSAHQNQGLKECWELVFSDGRTLVCTSDHRILTTDGSYRRADELVARESRVVLGLEGPLYKPTEDELAHRIAFKLDLSGFEPLHMLDRQGIARAHALARILGALYTDGSVSSNETSFRGKLCLGHAIDATQAEKDVELVTGTTPVHLPRERNTVKLTAAFVRALHQHPRICLPVGRRVAQAYNMPPIVMDENTPKSFVREFLRGLFGGDGEAPVPDGKSTWNTIVFYMSKEKQEEDSFTSFHAQLKQLLKQLDIHKTSIGQTVTTRYENGRVVLTRKFYVSLDETVAFQERVGFAYCAHKQQRLAVAAAYYRAKSYSMKQAQAIVNIVKEKAQFMPPKHGDPQRVFAMSIQEAHKAAIEELEKSEVIINADVAIPSKQQVANVLYGEVAFEAIGSRKMALSHEFLDQHAAAGFFSTPYCGDEKEDHDGNHKSNATDHSMIYGVSHDLDGFPSWETTFMGFKPAGLRTTYDITVPQKENFLANGITVHNCVPVVCRNDETSDWFHSVTEILHWNDRKQQKPTL